MASSDDGVIVISSDDSQEGDASGESSSKECASGAIHLDRKRRKIHMSDSEIQDYNQTESGGKPLVNPNLVKKSSKDPNRGLYPKPSKKALPGGFLAASSLLNPTLPFLPEPRPSRSSENTYNGKLSSSPTCSPSKLKSVVRSPIKQTRPGSILHFCVPRSTDMASSQDSSQCSQSSVLATDHVKSSQTSSTSTSSFSAPHSSTASPTGKEVGQKVGLTVTQRLFQAQRQVASTPSVKPAVRKKKKFTKPSTFAPKKDNKFLYPDPDEENNFVDPLSMGVKCKSMSVESDSDSSTEESSFFDILPTEIIENIFCRLPFLDLHLSLTRVCSNWNDVICDNKVCGKVYNHLKS